MGSLQGSGWASPGPLPPALTEGGVPGAERGLCAGVSLSCSPKKGSSEYRGLEERSPGLPWGQCG